MCDPRFSEPKVLAPKARADYAFILHILHYLSNKGRACIVCFPGIFYRKGPEKKIREYLINKNYIESIITLPRNLFYGTSISVNILLLNKNKTDNQIQFIDASSKNFFTKDIKKNIMQDNHIKEIMNTYIIKQGIEGISKMVSRDTIKRNDFNLSVNNYIDSKVNFEVTNIQNLEKEIESTVKKINKLRKKIKKMVKNKNHEKI